MTEGVAEVGQAGEVLGEPGQVRAVGLHGLAPGSQPRPGVEYRDQQHQLRALQQAAFRGTAPQHRPDVGDAIQGWRTLGAQSHAGLTGERDRGLDGGDVGERGGTLCALPPHRGS